MVSERLSWLDESFIRFLFNFIVEINKRKVVFTIPQRYCSTIEFSMGTFIVREDFLARTSDELTVKKGDVIIDGLPSGYGWIQGECRGKIGSVRKIRFS